MNDPIIISLLLSLPIYYFLNRNTLSLVLYIQDTYPLEWHKASSNRMKMSMRDLKQVRRVYLNDSLKFGFLSKQNDPYLARLLKVEKILVTVGFTIFTLGMIAAWVI
ncbi:hypothetical protein [Shewanella sp. SR44-3]|uniref:hypothetical protein n=1 Tax=unclassified Shewanella TaxID=196818 RepID=UPI0015F95533|nr:hypothetical protein [Shewanella sp. SR44-3]MBB1268860.1 hypothetical protein [Shewanella sp. SR44-3]